MDGCSVPGVADGGAGGGGEQPHHLRLRRAALPAVAGRQRGHQLRRHRLHPLPARRLPLRLLRRMLLDAARIRRRRARRTYASILPLPLLLPSFTSSLVDWIGQYSKSDSRV